ncbi:MAG TPA: valine--tRNA ligase [Bacillota bacterium]|nr:valine--tRNA ligase [Bacillota bacterium]
MTEIAKTYDPKAVEKKWYRIWEETGCFTPPHEPKGEAFTIVIPPPNVTDRLHVGHALDNTLQDVIIRLKRMQGYDTLWLPGTDHAGIATQNVVERNLLKTEGKSRHDLGREAFVEKVWEWKEQYGKGIIEQLKSIGASCDWSRERFTMDDGCSRAVREVFVRLYEKGLIYQGSYIVNWCPHCLTAISDDEVEHEERHGKLWHVRYPLEDGSGYITVATTRPETILGDTGVAVNPSDLRYSELVGKHALLPVLNRRIPIVADDYVDMEFGTGAVKVTPAHDPNDFEIGQRHDLPQVNVMNQDGTMNAEAGPFEGLDRYECRRQLLEQLESMGLLVKVVDHSLNVGTCYRCDTTIEPIVSKQWFVKMAPLAGPAIEAVRSGKVRFVPERFAKTYMHWVENVRDWCISRQLWWGHTLPVWYCACGEIVVSVDTPEICPHCGKMELRQETDVLDTWFSSALWPFATLGWPEETADLKRFFPTNVLVTGYDIIFFWVARMIFMSLEFMGEVPFSHVLIHGLVRDAEGRKMSKSLGNGIDPMAVVEEYGADTLRFTLLTGNTPGNDMRFYTERLESTRNFCNKIYNASRFILMNLSGHNISPNTLPETLSLADRYILSRLSRTASDVTRYMERYDFGEASRLMYEFVWNEFCDWYIEMAKVSLQAAGERKAEVLQVLCFTLSRALELLHPFMPFISEELWQALPHIGDSVTVVAWPENLGCWDDPDSEQKMEHVMEAIRGIRNVRAEMGVPHSRRAEIYIVAEGRSKDLYLDSAEYIKALAQGKDVHVVDEKAFGAGQAVSVLAYQAEIQLPITDLVDIAAETARLGKEHERLQEEIARAEAKLGNDRFCAQAPPLVVEQERAKLADYRERLEAVDKKLAELK